MTITLYKNSQYEADTPDLIYKDQWAVLPYETESMFCNGETTEKKDFVLPPDIIFNKADVMLNGFRYRNKSSCNLSTNDKGQPVLYVDSTSYIPPFILITQEEKKQIVQSAKNAASYWVPGYDKNGELEIF